MMNSKSFFLLLLVLVHFTAGAQDNSFKPSFSTIIDKSQGPALLQQCSRATPQNIKKYWTPTQADIDSLEHQFKQVLKLKNGVCDAYSQHVYHLEEFGYQYTGVTIKGKRYIYINAFHISERQVIDPKYKTIPHIVCDGGSGYWGALFSLETGTFSQLEFNGDA